MILVLLFVFLTVYYCGVVWIACMYGRRTTVGLFASKITSMIHFYSDQ